jgi:hypothetical protein
VKALVISCAMKLILYISQPYEGQAHDYPILQMEFPPAQDWFAKFEVRLDLGYQGFGNLYKCLKLTIPNKKPRNQELTDAQKNENTAFSKERVKVEHSLAGLKRFRILSDRLRIHDIKLYHEILGVCAGLWNFNLLYTTN